MGNVNTIAASFTECNTKADFKHQLKRTPLPSLKLALISTDLKDNPKIMSFLLEHCLEKGSGNLFTKTRNFKKIEPLFKIFYIALHVSTLKDKSEFMKTMERVKFQLLNEVYSLLLHSSTQSRSLYIVVLAFVSHFCYLLDFQIM